MNKKERLKFIVLYEASRNEYSISKHNLSTEEAQRLIEEGKTNPIPSFSLIVLNQTRRHQTADPQACRACREKAARSAGLSPQPKFVRREQS